MQNPITYMPMFITPDNPDELIELIKSTSHTEAGIMQAVCAAINMCHKMVQDEIDSIEA